MSHALLADFKTDPYLHQLREFEEAAETVARALLWQMRTGKTKVVIDTACHLFKTGLIDAVLVIAPNGVHENWTRRELPRHHWDTVEYEALPWRTNVAGTLAENHITPGQRGEWRDRHKAWWAKADAMLKSKDLPWFAFNSESMTREDTRKLIARIMRRRKVLVVFDESDDFRKPGSKRTKMARSLAKRAKFRRILTGTVITNSPLAAFSQYELLEREALGFKRYGDFKARYAYYELTSTRTGRQYPKLKEYIHLDELRERMAPWSSVVLREDCEDLPDIISASRTVTPSDEQLRLYRELHKSFTVEVEEGQKVSIGENTTRLTKLQQVLSGFLIDEYGDIHEIAGPNPRLEAMSDEVYLAPGKVIVWCQFREDIRRVVERLTADGHGLVEYHGGVSSENKEVNLDAFQEDPEIKILVGQPKAGGRGRDMSAADEIIWYSHTFDAIFREQATERATAILGANVRVVDLMGPGTDPYIRGRVEGNISIADEVAGRGMKEVLRECAI